MKEQYQREISRIHVPVELIEKTKLAMREEQAKMELPKAGKVISYKRLSIVAAAAVLLLVATPMVSELFVDNGQENTDMQMYLGEQEEKELEKITPQKSWVEELVDTIKDFFG